MLTKSLLSCSNKLRAFDESIAFHQHNAIVNDLSELFRDSSGSSAPSSISRLTSASSNSSLSSAVFPSINLPIGERKVVEVQFRYVFRHYRLPVLLSDIQPGEFVLVQSFVDKSQEDLGVVTRIYTPEEFDALKEYEGPSEDADENKVGRVLRLALPEELKYLPMKFQREHPLLRICQTFVERNMLPMTVYGVEYQYDGNVLYVYYVSKDRVDFRPLVKFLIKMYCKGTRIQMKKTNQCRDFVPVAWASEALITGKHCAPLSAAPTVVKTATTTAGFDAVVGPPVKVSSIPFSPSH